VATTTATHGVREVVRSNSSSINSRNNSSSSRTQPLRPPLSRPKILTRLMEVTRTIVPCITPLCCSNSRLQWRRLPLGNRILVVGVARQASNIHSLTRSSLTDSLHACVFFAVTNRLFVSSAAVGDS
jgi:hypothetical protein